MNVSHVITVRDRDGLSQLAHLPNGAQAYIVDENQFVVRDDTMPPFLPWPWRNIDPVNDAERVWWCALERAPIDLADMNRPTCGPDMQCTGGRRANLPCGWYRLVPDPDPENDESAVTPEGDGA